MSKKKRRRERIRKRKKKKEEEKKKKKKKGVELQTEFSKARETQKKYTDLQSLVLPKSN